MKSCLIIGVDGDGGKGDVGERLTLCQYNSKLLISIWSFDHHASWMKASPIQCPMTTEFLRLMENEFSESDGHRLIQNVHQLDLGQDVLAGLKKRKNSAKKSRLIVGGGRAECIANGPTRTPYRNRNSATEVCMICRDDPHRLKKK